jgi:hypothetical protein
MPRVSIVLAFAVALAACRAPSGEEAIALMEEMAEVFHRNKGDCDKLGASLDAFIEKNRDRFEKLEAYDRGLTVEQRKEFERRYGDRADGAMKKIMSPEVAACGDHAKVKEALGKISPS